jgi:hypothetical protein
MKPFGYAEYSHKEGYLLLLFYPSLLINYFVSHVSELLHRREKYTKLGILS